MAGSSGKVVAMAIVGNGVLTAVKFFAWTLSGSGSMFSECVHSLADTLNQGLIYIGVRKSDKPADKGHPDGYGVDRYFFNLLSAAGIFVLGCGVTVAHGVHSLSVEEVPSYSNLTWGVLGLALVVDGFVLWMAVREIRKIAGKTPFFKFLKETSDPSIPAVLLEDGVACIGVLIAAASILISKATGNPIFDAIGSILIGLLMGAIAIWLAQRNRKLILGQAIPKEVEEGVMEFLRTHPNVRAVRDVRSRVLGASAFRLKADIEFDGRALGEKHAIFVTATFDNVDREVAVKFSQEFAERVITDLGDEIDRIEAEIATRWPKLKHIDFEAD